MAAEEDRHGNVLRDYVRDSRLLNFSVLERLQFEYIRSGFNPDWRGDPYRIFVYTLCQEKATQISHLNTGKLVAQEEPLLYSITQKISQDEARHFAFYMNIFKEILHRDPNHALLSACSILLSIEMPGISIINFNEYADVVRRAGIYGPREYKLSHAVPQRAFGSTLCSAGFCKWGSSVDSDHVVILASLSISLYVFPEMSGS